MALDYCHDSLASAGNAAQCFHFHSRTHSRADAQLYGSHHGGTQARTHFVPSGPPAGEPCVAFAHTSTTTGALVLAAPAQVRDCAQVARLKLLPLMPLAAVILTPAS
jgi:hypothetical protein